MKQDPTTLDLYNNSYVMPLHQFIAHPVVQWNIHNGAAKQVGSPRSRRVE